MGTERVKQHKCKREKYLPDCCCNLEEQHKINQILQLELSKWVVCFARRVKSIV